MSPQIRWLIVGALFGVALAFVVVTGGTHGVSGESELERRSEQYFFFIPLFDVRGEHEAVKSIERWWSVRLYTGGMILGGVLGIAATEFIRRTLLDYQIARSSVPQTAVPGLRRAEHDTRTA